MKMTTLSCACFGAAMALGMGVATSANASAVVAATEPTQILNNIQLVQSYAQQVQMVRHELESVVLLKQQLKQLDPRTIGELSNSAIDQVNNLAELSDQLGDLLKSSHATEDVLERARKGVQDDHTTPQQYLKDQALLAQQRGSVNAKMFQQDSQTLAHFKEETAHLQQLAATTPDITSNVSGFQHLLMSNAHMQAQLAQLNGAVARANMLAERASSDANQGLAATTKLRIQRQSEMDALSKVKVQVPSPSRYADPSKPIDKNAPVDPNGH